MVCESVMERQQGPFSPSRRRKAHCRTGRTAQHRVTDRKLCTTCSRGKTQLPVAASFLAEVHLTARSSALAGRHRNQNERQQCSTPVLSTYR